MHAWLAAALRVRVTAWSSVRTRVLQSRHFSRFFIHSAENLHDRRIALMLNEALMCGIDVAELSDVITDYFTDRSESVNTAAAAAAEIGM